MSVLVNLSTLALYSLPIYHRIKLSLIIAMLILKWNVWKIRRAPKAVLKICYLWAHFICLIIIWLRFLSLSILAHHSTCNIRKNVFLIKELKCYHEHLFFLKRKNSPLNPVFFLRSLMLEACSCLGKVFPISRGWKTSGCQVPPLYSCLWTKRHHRAS